MITAWTEDGRVTIHEGRPEFPLVHGEEIWADYPYPKEQLPPLLVDPAMPAVVRRRIVAWLAQHLNVKLAPVQ